MDVYSYSAVSVSVSVSVGAVVGVRLDRQWRYCVGGSEGGWRQTGSGGCWGGTVFSGQNRARGSGWL